MPVIIATTPEQKRAGRYLSAITIPSLLMLFGLTALVWVVTDVAAIAAVVATVGMAALCWAIPAAVRRRHPGSLPAAVRDRS